MTDPTTISALDYMRNRQHLISWSTSDSGPLTSYMFPVDKVLHGLDAVRGTVDTAGDFTATELGGITWCGRPIVGLTITPDRTWAAEHPE